MEKTIYPHRNVYNVDNVNNMQLKLSTESTLIFLDFSRKYERYVNISTGFHKDIHKLSTFLGITNHRKCGNVGKRWIKFLIPDIVEKKFFFQDIDVEIRRPRTSYPHSLKSLKSL